MPHLLKTPRIPISGFEDGAQVIDVHGAVWEFQQRERTWIFKGIIAEPELVTTEQPGLIPPSIFRKLSLLRSLKDAGVSFASFKIGAPDSPKPYFYLFNSSDSSIKFKPEPPGKLRLEIDRERLYSQLVYRCCPGPRGDKGLDGFDGNDGLPAANEVFRTPLATTDSTFVIDTAVAAPIDTPISIRIFREDEQIAELIVPIDGSAPELTLLDSALDIEETSLEASYDVTSERLRASIKFTAGADDIDELLFKARQKGPEGRIGVDGLSILQIVNLPIADPAILAKEVAVSIRRTEPDGDISVLKQQPTEEVCVSKLKLSEELQVGPLNELNIAAVEVTIRDCKTIGRFKFDADVETPPLILPQWTPLKDCRESSFFFMYNFEWWKRTDPRYLFTILPDPIPAERCCQDDFFFCPNVSDGPCSVQGSVDPRSEFPGCRGEPKLTEPKSPFLTGQGQPADTETARAGLNLTSCGVLNPSPAASQGEGQVMDGGNGIFTAEGVLDGQVDIWTVTEKVSGNVTITVATETISDLDTEDENKCKIASWSTIATGCNSNGVAGAFGDLKTFSMSCPIIERPCPITKPIGRAFQCPESTIKIATTVQAGEQGCCKRYKVIISVKSSCPEDSCRSKADITEQEIPSAQLPASVPEAPELVIPSPQKLSKPEAECDDTRPTIPGPELGD